MVRIRTMREFLWQIAEQYGDADAYSWDDNGTITNKSYIDLNDDVTKLAREIHRLFGEQRKIAIIGDASYTYICTFFGTIASANIAIPLDAKMQKQDIIDRLNFTDVSIVALSEKYSDLKDDIMNSCRRVNRVISIENFIYDIPAISEKEVLSIVYPDQVSVMLFTSGTTGNGYKAAMLTQDGVLSSIKRYVPIYKPGDRVLSVLPIHHCFDLCYCQLKALYSGCTICINDSMNNLVKNLIKFKINSMVAVPAIANLLCSIIENNKNKPIDEIRALIGGCLQRVTLGGAPINAKLVEVLESINIQTFNAYGLTETCGGVLFNADPKTNIESVGSPCAYSLDIKISEEGELCLRGPAIMAGYYKQPELSAKVITDGWFHTGDTAHIDENGCVIITGRKDNLIKLSGGEKVYPEKWEDKIDKINGVTTSMVCAINGHLTAVIYARDINDIVKNSIIDAINKLNTNVPGYEKISDIRFRDTPFPLTSSMKVKRKEAIEELLSRDKLTKYVPPQNNIQTGILIHVKHILPYAEEKISITDNLYDLGLDSLSTLELSIALDCAPNLIYECKTVKALSEKIDPKNQMDIQEINKQLKYQGINDYIPTDKHLILKENSTILITGATGFLGPHIIKELQKLNFNIICLVRSLDRFQKNCEYYGVDNKNLTAIVGNITERHFGLPDDDYIHLCKKTDAVFHVAATVNHVGNVEDSYNINVKGTERIARFCKSSEAVLYHMSSFAVTGFNSDRALTEDMLDIDQQITQNPYIQTKYQAEECVLRARVNGINSTIFRIGNLTKRALDGLFQMNAETSGRSAQIRALNSLGYYPSSMNRMIYDNTPVDKAAEAIVKLAANNGTGCIWHILNPNIQKINEIANVKEIDDKTFDELLNAHVSDTDTGIFSIYYKMIKDGLNMNFDTTATVHELKKLGFTW